jgi:hypothetical protein
MPDEQRLIADYVVVPRATYEQMCHIVRSWDAWCLTGKQDDELRNEVTIMTAKFCGSEAGSRMVEPLNEGVAEGWYSDRFGFHQHPEEWPLNITHRAHERCRRAWVEEGRTDG